MTTVMLIHGAFVNARFWDPVKARYEAAGHTVLAPPWPHDDGEPAALRAHPPAALAGVGVGELVDHYATHARALPSPPALIGHSFGGLVVQLLLDQGVGRCGVAIHPAPPRGVPPTWGLVAANFPMVRNPFAAGSIRIMDKAHWAERFANGLPLAQAEAAWEALSIPTPDRPFFQALTFSSSLAVRWHSDTRPPLLIYAGSGDRTVPVEVNRANARMYRGAARTELREWPGRSHFTLGEPGWEEVADAAMAWIEGI